MKAILSWSDGRTPSCQFSDERFIKLKCVFPLAHLVSRWSWATGNYLCLLLHLITVNLYRNDMTSLYILLKLLGSPMTLTGLLFYKRQVSRCLFNLGGGSCLYEYGTSRLQPPISPLYSENATACFTSSDVKSYSFVWIIVFLTHRKGP